MKIMLALCFALTLLGVTAGCTATHLYHRDGGGERTAAGDHGGHGGGRGGR